MLRKYWIHFVIVTVIVSLISIKGFPLALGALYLPLLFKIVQLQLNLSKGLIDNVNVHTFIKSNQSGVVISVICCLLITGVLTYTLDDFIMNYQDFRCFSKYKSCYSHYRRDTICFNCNCYCSGY